jgi:Predicted membrane protein (DUF2142)
VKTRADALVIPLRRYSWPVVLPRLRPVATFVVVALVFGVAMLFLTPPFQVPDEVGHFWHSYALARAVVFPTVVAGRAIVELPQGARDIVAVLWVAPGTHTTFTGRLRSAMRLPYSSQRVPVKYPVLYSPFPYLPQAIGCFVGDLFRLRPLATFYLGRLANLLGVIVVIGYAIRASEEMAWIVCVVGLLPMSVFLFASYSADALTIAFALLVTVLARNPTAALYPTAFALGLCKPPYLLIVLLAFATRRWRAATAAAAAALAGGIVAALFATGSFAAMRSGVNPAMQVQLMQREPGAVMRIVAHDLAENSSDYVEELVGRLGWLDIWLPRVAYYAVLALLAAVAVTAGVSASASERITAAAIWVASVVAIELSDFITWTLPGSQHIEGVQGRYFLPLLPLLYVAVSRPARAPRWLPVTIAFVAVLANSAALFVLRQRYFD